MAKGEKYRSEGAAVMVEPVTRKLPGGVSNTTLGYKLCTTRDEKHTKIIVEALNGTKSKKIIRDLLLLIQNIHPNFKEIEEDKAIKEARKYLNEGPA